MAKHDQEPHVFEGDDVDAAQLTTCIEQANGLRGWGSYQRCCCRFGIDAGADLRACGRCRKQ